MWVRWGIGCQTENITCHAVSHSLCIKSVEIPAQLLQGSLFLKRGIGSLRAALHDD
jgi:hypothetical protein